MQGESKFSLHDHSVGAKEGLAENKYAENKDSKPGGSKGNGDSNHETNKDAKTQPTVCAMFADQEVAQAKGNAEANNKSLLWRAVDFVSKDLLLKLDDYFIKHVQVFDPFSDEHKLEYTEAYTEYERLFDLHLEAFAEKEGFTTTQFYEHISRASSDSKPIAKMLKLFIARSDYQKFVAMMKRRHSIACECSVLHISKLTFLSASLQRRLKKCEKHMFTRMHHTSARPRWRQMDVGRHIIATGQAGMWQLNMWAVSSKHEAGKRHRSLSSQQQRN